MNRAMAMKKKKNAASSVLALFAALFRIRSRRASGVRA
jgi:hypothetical protein